jgi:hypothetical protein
MKLLSYLLLWSGLLGLVLAVVTRLFYFKGFFGVGYMSFFSYTFLAALLVIGASLIRLASRP